MITVSKYLYNGEDFKYHPFVYHGLSTDQKPTDAMNGATFIEIDTGAMHRFDAENGEWVEWTTIIPADGEQF